MTRRFLGTALLAAGFICAAAAAPIVSDAWIRALPGKLPAGGYFILHNSGPKPITLTGANSPACGMAMLHKSDHVGGMAHMTMVDRIDLPAGATVRFEPGGYHVMCMDPKGLAPGTTVPFTLGFSDGSRVTVPFAVKNATGN